jgi:hypothetical protein
VAQFRRRLGVRHRQFEFKFEVAQTSSHGTQAVTVTSESSSESSSEFFGPACQPECGHRDCDWQTVGPAAESDFDSAAANDSPCHAATGLRLGRSARTPPGPATRMPDSWQPPLRVRDSVRLGVPPPGDLARVRISIHPAGPALPADTRPPRPPGHGRPPSRDS